MRGAIQTPFGTQVVGGAVDESQNLQPITKVPPVYPPLARAARVQGVVVLEVTIAKDGTVTNATVVSGHPLLTQAGIDAVKQWIYAPQAQEITTKVTINFAF